MKEYKYVIIGGGMTGDAAVRGIRKLDSEGTIAMLSMEPDMPYARPPLSKGMWKGRPFERVWRGTDQLNVEFHLKTQAVELDPSRKLVRDQLGGAYVYDKLLLATGGTPNRLPFGGDDIIYYRTLQDYLRLRALVDAHNDFIVLGGSFIGSELAAALAMQKKRVTMLFLERSICEANFPPDLSEYLSDFYRQKGVQLLSGDSLTAVERKGTRLIARTRSGHTLEADGIVAGIGIRPNVELAQAAGLAVEDGVVVDDYQRTSQPDIFAAGDVARFPHLALGEAMRVEHEDNALKMGKQAGRNMAGADEVYAHAPTFYSDLFELGYEAVGILNRDLEIYADWQEPFRKGVLYYLDRGRVRGVLLWDVWKKLEQASAIVADPGPFTVEDLKGRIKVEQEA